jgi:hypothetical protein
LYLSGLYDLSGPYSIGPPYAGMRVGTLQTLGQILQISEKSDLLSTLE